MIPNLEKKALYVRPGATDMRKQISGSPNIPDLSILLPGYVNSYRSTGVEIPDLPE